MTHHSKPPIFPKTRRHGGFAFAYVIGMIALMAAIAAATISMARTNSVANYIFNTTSSVYAAANVISTKIRYCPLSFPGGDNGTGYAIQYPGATTEVLVVSLVCPGRSAYTLFTGGDGVFLPQTPAQFTGWTYLNDSLGVRIKLVSDGSDAHNAILANVAAKFTTTEASLSGSTLTIWIKTP